MARIQITGSQIKNATLLNAHIVDATIQEAKLADSGKFLRTDAKRAWTSEQDAGGLKLTNLAVGTNPNDAVTYQQLQDNSAGLDPKESVRAATTEAITLSGAQTIDGVSVVAGDRVLVKDQADAKTNGIYVAAAGAWTRSGDMDGTPTAEISGGNYTYVEQGTVNAGCGYVVVADGEIALGTDNIVWTQFSGAGLITAGNGLLKSGNTIDVRLTDGLFFTGAGTDFIGVKVNSNGTLVVNGDGVKLADLAEGKILIGSAGSVATAQTLSGDVTLVANGTTTIGAGKVLDSMIASGVSNNKINLTAGKVLIGQTATGKADEMAVSGDVTISESGVTTIGAAKVVDSMIASGVSNNKITLSAGKVLIGQTATGKADEMTVTGDVTISELGVTAIGSGKVTNAMLEGSISVAKVSVAQGKVIIGNASGVGAEQSVTGDVTISVAGVTTIGEAKVLDSMLATGITATKLSLAQGKVLIGDSSGAAAAQTVSGDVTITEGGVTSIGADKVTNTMLVGSIAVGKLTLAENKLILGNSSSVGTAGLTFVPDSGLNWTTVTNTDVVSATAVKNYISQAATFVDEEQPSGDKDGVNTAFTLAYTPVAGSLKVFLNGQRLLTGAGADFTVSGTALTLNFAPEAGDVLVAEYRK